MLHVIPEAGGLRGIPVLRGLPGRPQGFRQAIQPIQGVLRPRHGQGCGAEARRQVPGAETPPEAAYDAGIGFPVRIGFRERRAPVLCEAGPREMHGHRQELRHHPPGLLRGVRLLRHSRPSGEDRCQQVRGVDNRRGPVHGGEEGLQRDDPGRGGTHGQHVRHRMRRKGNQRCLQGPQVPRREALPETPHRPFKADRSSQEDIRSGGCEEGLRQLRHPLRHGPGRQGPRGRIPLGSRLQPRLRPDEGGSGAHLRQGSGVHGEARAGFPAEIQGDVRPLHPRMRQGPVPDLLLHGRTPGLHRRRYARIIGILQQGAEDAPGAGPGIHPRSVHRIHHDVLHLHGCLIRRC